MAMTVGTGPFGQHPAGQFDTESGATAGEHVRYLERSPKRVRAVVDGKTVVDSQAPRMLFETGAMPIWWFPREDVSIDARTDDDPLLDGLVTLPEDIEVAWWEDDEQMVGHPRDPYHRIDTRRSTEHVVVRVGGEVVAESRRPVRLYETALPPRFYLPPEDVHYGVLGPAGLHTTCPYKGIASYRSVTGGGQTVPEAAWYYPEPFGEALEVRDHLCFMGDGVEVLVDDQPAP